MGETLKIVKHLEPKTINDRLEDIENQLSLIMDKLAAITPKLLNAQNSPVSDSVVKRHSRSMQLLKEVYEHHGIVTSAQLHVLSKELGVGRVGPLFRGSQSSLKYIMSSRGPRVALSEFGYQRLVQSGLIEERLAQ